MCYKPTIKISYLAFKGLGATGRGNLNELVTQAGARYRNASLLEQREKDCNWCIKQELFYRCFERYPCFLSNFVRINLAFQMFLLSQIGASENKDQHFCDRYKETLQHGIHSVCLVSAWVQRALHIVASSSSDSGSLD